MKISSLSLSLLCSLTLLSCKKYDNNGNEIKSFNELAKAKWLIGEWEKKDSLGTLKEIWQNEDDSTFVGKSYYLQNDKDTLFNEQIELIQEKDHLIYRATIVGENNDEPVPFQLTKATDSLLIFENPKHNYPQKIEYQLKKSKNITATISGKQNGKWSSESYPMTKIK
jgi:hypothetical protein